MSTERPITSRSPRISVVVPTLPSNDHDEVIDRLRRQTHDDFEVIVVNDAALDICEARNEGIEAAAADIVALTDDDCLPEPDWLEAIDTEFVDDEELVCLEGAVHGGRTYDGGRRYVGCNLAFTREAALSVGGFRSDYAGWRDDTEFGWRMERDVNGRCRFSKHVRMHHPPLPRANIDTEKETRLRREYPNRYEEIIVPDTLVGRVNDWLWRNGVWNAVDRIRYGGNTT